MYEYGAPHIRESRCYLHTDHIYGAPCAYAVDHTHIRLPYNICGAYTAYTVHHTHMRLTIRIYGGRIPYGARYTHRICMVKRNGGAHTVHRIRTVYGAAPYTVWHHILCMCSTVAGSRRTTLALCMARHHILHAHGAPRTRRRMHTQYMAQQSCHHTTHIQYMVRHEPRNPPPGKYSL